MIKGCTKKVIWMRNTESELFDEAYFILSEAASKGEARESDIVKEAKRIIARSPVANYWETDPDSKSAGANSHNSTQSFGEKKRRRAAGSLGGKALLFFIGLAIGTCVTFLLMLP
ncbi:MAG: hypothetical protein IKB34_00080 [Clostridia bacterium]|nr:hypothetical protein [Clostridia bacterium]